MRKLLITVCAIAVLVFMAGCSDNKKDENDLIDNDIMDTDIDDNDIDDNVIDENIVSFTGVIAEINGNVLIVKPNEDEDIRKSGDSVSISLDQTQVDTLVVGDKIRVTYDGDVMESYPLQINVIRAEKVD